MPKKEQQRQEENNSKAGSPTTMKNKRQYPLYIQAKDTKKARVELYNKKVKGKVPQAGPGKKKKPTKDPFWDDTKDTYLACQQHERLKPLRWQGYKDYLKAVYDPDPEE